MSKKKNNTPAAWQALATKVSAAFVKARAAIDRAMLEFVILNAALIEQVISESGQNVKQLCTKPDKNGAGAGALYPMDEKAVSMTRSVARFLSTTDERQRALLPQSAETLYELSRVKDAGSETPRYADAVAVAREIEAQILPANMTTRQAAELRKNAAAGKTPDTETGRSEALRAVKTAATKAKNAKSGNNADRQAFQLAAAMLDLLTDLVTKTIDKTASTNAAIAAFKVAIAEAATASGIIVDANAPKAAPMLKAAEAAPKKAAPKKAAKKAAPKKAAPDTAEL